MRLPAKWAAPLAVAAMATGCDNSSNQVVARSGGSELIRAEAACDRPNLSRPLRQTLLLVDARAISKADDALTFAQKNADFRDLVLSVADPIKAVASGTSAARERVIIAVVPSDGSAAEVTFTGCLPALSAEELSAATRDQSTLSSVFSASPAGQMEKEAEAFRNQLIGGMVAAAKRADGDAGGEGGPIEQSHYLQGVRASRTLLDVRDVVQRVVLVSDLSRLTIQSDSDPAKSFAAGAAAGTSSGGDLGRVELHVVLPAGRAAPDRAYLRGFFLAQQAALSSVAAGHIGPSGAPPVRLWRFAGEASYPSRAQLIDVRIGDDGQGKLSGSWLTLLGDPRFAIPLTGQIVCSGKDSCKATSDNAGFAQVWTGQTGGAPRFSNELPFGGMRNFALEIADRRLSGRASDPDVYVGPDQAKNSIAINAEAKQ